MDAFLEASGIAGAIADLFVADGLTRPEALVMPGAELVVPATGDDDCVFVIGQVPRAVFVDNFPQAATNGCAGRPAYEMRFTVFRCLPVGEAGNDPDPEEVQDVAQLFVGDERRIRLGICRTLSGRYEYNFQTWEGSGPQGGIVGGSWTVLVDSAPAD